MKNPSDTDIGRKEALKKRMTIVYALLGIIAAPIVFIWAFPGIAAFMPWVREAKPLYIGLTFLGAIASAIAWSIFALVGWKRGNVGARIGLTAVIWALAAAVVLVVLARLATEAL